MLLMLVAAFLLITYPVAAFNIERLGFTFHRLPTNHPQYFADWLSLMQRGQDMPIEDKLKRVNEFFNRRIQFAPDQTVWGKSDYWATPMETLAKGAGDCEDFTIAKYFSLLSLKVPDQQLRLIYVKARIGGPSSAIEEAHMVLAYYPSPDAEPLVLDNLITDIRPASRRPDLLPVFSFNRQGIYAGVTLQAQAGAGGVGQLSRWSDLLQRAGAEGFD